MTNDLEHPTITALRQNGLPIDEPVTIYCDECGNEIKGEAYEDEEHSTLCLDCLKFLYRRSD